MKSKMEDVIEATRIVSKLDKRGKLAILRDLQKQGLEPKVSTTTGANVPVAYSEGGET